MEVKQMKKSIITTKGQFELVKEGVIGGKKDQQKYKIFKKNNYENLRKNGDFREQNPANPHEYGASNGAYGTDHKSYTTPLDFEAPRDSVTLISTGAELMKPLLVGFDIEWATTAGETFEVYVEDKTGDVDIKKTLEQIRDIVSYQFFFNVNGEDYGILLYNNLVSDNSSGLSSSSVFRNFYQVLEQIIIIKNRHLKLVLVAHYALFDATGFLDSHVFLKNGAIVKGKNLGSSRPIYITKIYNSKRNKATLEILIRDSAMMGGAGSLAKLGAGLGLEKLDNTSTLSSGEPAITNARLWMEERPDEFDGYALSDAMISYEWIHQGFSEYEDDWFKLPTTIAALAASQVFENITSMYGWSKKDYNHHFRGLSSEKINKTGKAIATSLDYRPALLDTVLIASEAYHGGYNASFTNGLYKGQTWDYDIRNAYPAAMSILSDIDFDVTSAGMSGKLHLSSFSPDDYLFALVDFKFDKHTKFPTIPIYTGTRGLVHPLESGRDGIFATAPELYAALLQGADITVIKAFKMNTLDRKTLREVMRSGIQKRIELQKKYGKKSPQQAKQKEINNSVSGKLAQGVSANKTFDIEGLETTTIGPSILTNPYMAAMTTSLVRGLLVSVMHEIEKMGYKVFSITTDGFISNIPPHLLDSIRIPKLTDLFEEAEEFLTNDKRIFEVKHTQDVLVNIRTRGNIGLNLNQEGDGVFALASYKIPREIREGAPEAQKRYMAKLFAKRDNEENKIVSKYSRIPSIRDFMLGNKDLVGDLQEVETNFEYDWKRIPMNPRIETLELDGEEYELLTFDTLPISTKEEFMRNRDVIDKEKIMMKTLDDFEEIMFRLEMAKAGARNVISLERTKANQILRNIRAGNIKTNKNSDEIIENVKNYYNISLDRKAWNDAGRKKNQEIMIDPIFLINDIKKMEIV